MSDENRRAVRLSKWVHADEMEPFGEKDKPVIEAVQEVLERLNATERFGLALLHSHFEIADDEVLVESCDVQSRTLSVRPMKHQDLPDQCCLVLTLWAFDGAHCIEHYPTCKDGRHYGSKERL